VHAERVIDSGLIVSTLPGSLSFAYQYRLNIIITDYAGNIDLMIVPCCHGCARMNPTLW